MSSNEFVALRTRLGQLRPLRGLLLALFMSLLFLALTAYESAVTLFNRIDQTDVMKAASGAAITGRIGREVAWFAVAQLSLHAAFAAVAWLTALASAVLWDRARERFNLVVVGWFSLFAAATVVYNAYWFPRTLMGAYYNDLVSTAVGPWPIAKIVYIGIVLLALLVLVAAATKAVRQLLAVRPTRSVAVACAVAAVGLVTVIWAATGSGSAAGPASERPNVIILGIDSLRLDQLQRFGGSGATPNLDRFLDQADVMSDTTTPAARTFSSWMAILTGRSPVATGARFNLAPRSRVASNPTIGDVLRQHGYRAVYSTDEVRFANIDETYGFDQVITPRIGASDFLIGTYNELPLASVVINTRLGQWLFPFSFGNRGAATMFQPDTYLGRVEQELSFNGPTLFIAHLTAAHWPYYVSDTPFGLGRGSESEISPLYRDGLETADRMFGELLAMLQRKGALDNALVIVLSDHGEAFGLPTDTLAGDSDSLFIAGLRAPIKMNDYGHGQSVLSPSQYKVLLGFRPYGEFSRFRSTARDLDLPVTVEDIAPTILELLEVGGDPLEATGRSLVPVLRGSNPIGPELASGRIRFTETDLSVLPAPDGGVDEIGTARQNSMFFSIDYDTGRLELNKRYEPLAVAFKERAAFSKEMLLAALPAGPNAHQYLLFDLATGRGRLLLEAPGPELPRAQELWDALHEHYRGELRPAVAVTREDWPRIDAEWKSFVNDRSARDSQGSAKSGMAEPSG